MAVARARIANRKAAHAGAAAARSQGAGVRSKTGAPMCSQAMSSWVKSRHGGPPASSEVYKILAKCRAMAARNKSAAAAQASGKLAEGRGTWQRAEQASAIRAQRSAVAAPAAPRNVIPIAKPSSSSSKKAATGLPPDWEARRDRVKAAKRAKGGNLSDDELDRLFPEDRRGKGQAPRKPIPAQPNPSARAKGRGTPERMSRAALLRGQRRTDREVIDDYMDAGHGAVNRALAGKPPGFDPTATDLTIAQRIASLDRRASRRSRTEEVVYRGVDPSSFGVDPSKLQGKTLRVPTFMSTSKSFQTAAKPNFNRGLLLKLRAPAGTRRADLSRENLDEREVILARGQRIKFGKLQERAGGPKGETTRILSGEVIVPGSPERLARAAQLRAERAQRATAKPKPKPKPTSTTKRTTTGKPGSIVLHHKAMDPNRLAQLAARPTTIDGEDFTRRKDLRGQSSLLDRVSTDRSGAKAPERGDLERTNLAKRIREARAKAPKPRDLTADFGADRMKLREKHNAAVFHRRDVERPSKPRTPTEAQATPGPRPRQGGLFERPDARATPRDAEQSQRLADRLWAMGQRQKRAGDADASGTFARHDELMSRAYRLLRKKDGTAIQRAGSRDLVRPVDPVPPRALRKRDKGDPIQRARLLAARSNKIAKKARRAGIAAEQKGDLERAVKKKARALAATQRTTALLERAGTVTGKVIEPKFEVLGTTPAPAPPDFRRKPPEPTDAPKATRETKRSEWRAMVESARRDQATRREKRAARLGKLRGERSQGVRDLKPSQIQADPDRFQYKLAHNKEGSVGSLSGVRKWDPERGGILQVWRDPADGKTYVVNGHNRLELARRVGAEKVTVRYIQARDATEARAKGAITNIVEGRGTSVDAAKFLRDQKLTRREDFDALDLPVREKVATEGLALAGLEPRAFRAVIDGNLPVQRAAIVGGSGLSHAQQRAALDLVEKRKGEITDKVLKELVSEVKMAGTARKGGGGLFGDDPEETSLAIHRASLVAHVKDRLGREKRVFGVVAKSKNARDLERAGNTIDVDASGKVSQRAAENLGVFDQMRRLRGSTSDLIAEAEQRLARGESKAQVYADFYERLPKALKADAR